MIKSNPFLILSSWLNSELAWYCIVIYHMNNDKCLVISKACILYFADLENSKTRSKSFEMMFRDYFVSISSPFQNIPWMLMCAPGSLREVTILNGKWIFVIGLKGKQLVKILMISTTTQTSRVSAGSSSIYKRYVVKYRLSTTGFR